MTTKTTPTRIATTADGRKFVVQNIDFRANVVRCWGEVLSYRGLSTTHGPSLTFPCSDVVVSTEPKTPAMMRALLAQAERAADANPELRDMAHPGKAADRAFAQAFFSDPAGRKVLADMARAIGKV